MKVGSDFVKKWWFLVSINKSNARQGLIRYAFNKKHNEISETYSFKFKYNGDQLKWLTTVRRGCCFNNSSLLIQFLCTEVVRNPDSPLANAEDLNTP